MMHLSPEAGRLLYGEARGISSKIVNKAQMPTTSPTICMSQTRGITIGKKTSKVICIADDMTVYLENPRGSMI